MRPVIVILIGAILIAIGVIFASHMAPGVGVILGIGGVATILVGIAMLFGLAQEKK
jgi:multisubunit Na+/H+ antiporter MnhB subunit